jgi:hypothetical protein
MGNKNQKVRNNLNTSTVQIGKRQIYPKSFMQKYHMLSIETSIPSSGSTMTCSMGKLNLVVGQRPGSSLLTNYKIALQTNIPKARGN